MGRSLATGKFVDWAASNAEGASGGIHILWDLRIPIVGSGKELCHSFLLF